MKKTLLKVAVITMFLLGSIGLSGCGLLYNMYANMSSGGSGASFRFRGFGLVHRV